MFVCMFVMVFSAGAPAGPVPSSGPSIPGGGPAPSGPGMPGLPLPSRPNLFAQSGAGVTNRYALTDDFGFGGDETPTPALPTPNILAAPLPNDNMGGPMPMRPMMPMIPGAGGTAPGAPGAQPPFILFRPTMPAPSQSPPDSNPP